MCWATFWASFSQTLLVALIDSGLSSSHTALTRCTNYSMYLCTRVRYLLRRWTRSRFPCSYNKFRAKVRKFVPGHEILYPGMKVCNRAWKFVPTTLYQGKKVYCTHKFCTHERKFVPTSFVPMKESLYPQVLYQGLKVCSRVCKFVPTYDMAYLCMTFCNKVWSF
jgi:hypothetical protein